MILENPVNGEVEVSSEINFIDSPAETELPSTTGDPLFVVMDNHGDSERRGVANNGDRDKAALVRGECNGLQGKSDGRGLRETL